MVEEDLEHWARREILLRGGMMLKWTSPSVRGVPDDICFWPGGIIHFIEFKWDVEQPDALQQTMHQRLHSYGHEVLIVRNKQWLVDYIRAYCPR